MLLSLSPAKTLDFESASPPWPCSMPEHLSEAQRLIERLREFSIPEFARLMNLSDKLASLNVARNLAWCLPFCPENARAALAAFNGDVYEGLDARSLTLTQVEFAQRHLRILSGLYGVLRPLDLIQPYRLEMGTRLKTVEGKDLYAFWGPHIVEHLNTDLRNLGASVLVNLASEEYFKSVRVRDLKARVITPVFEDFKNGRFKVISFFAKRARGRMARYVIENGLDQPEGLKSFCDEGYAFDPRASDALHWVFRRKEAA